MLHSPGTSDKFAVPLKEGTSLLSSAGRATDL